MKCKYCGAKGIKISHFMKKHKALMLRKSRAGRKRGGHRKSSGGGSGKTLGTGGHRYVTLRFHD